MESEKKSNAFDFLLLFKFPMFSLCQSALEKFEVKVLGRIIKMKKHIFGNEIQMGIDGFSLIKV